MLHCIDFIQANLVSNHIALPNSAVKTVCLLDTVKISISVSSCFNSGEILAY